MVIGLAENPTQWCQNGPWLAQWSNLISAMCGPRHVKIFPFSPGIGVGGVHLAHNVGQNGFNLLGHTELPRGM